jgi:hypothetical protein
MMVIRRATVCGVIAGMVIAVGVGAQQPLGDAQAMTQFLRAADAYAFQHRQIQRRTGEPASRSAMASALRKAQAISPEGTLFTPPIAAAFRNRIAAALRAAGCRQPAPPSAVVPRPSEDADGAELMAPCITDALPRLPEELEYRITGVALLLVDTHAHLVVDVLHAAIP